MIASFIRTLLPGTCLALGVTTAGGAAPLDTRSLFDPKADGPIHASLSRGLDQSANKDLHARPRTFDVVHYDLHVEVDPALGAIHGSMRVQLTALVRQLATVELDALDFQIDGVAALDGSPLAYRYDGKLLVVTLPALLPAGETTAFRVVYRALTPEGLEIAGPDATDPTRMPAAYTFTEPDGSKTWFPCVDRPDEKATVEMTITVPRGHKALSNGDPLRPFGVPTPGLLGDVFAYRMEQEIAPYLMSLAVGPYEVLSLGSYEGKPLTVWTPATLVEAAMIETEGTKEMLAAFADFTGLVYPFNSYSQSVAQAYGTSMEHQTATTMGGNRIRGDKSGEGVVAHELAHQWFGDWVTCRTWGELWLNEGFATYLPMIYFQSIGAATRAVGELDWWRAGYFEEAAERAHALSEANPDENLFDSHAYEKGGIVVHLMRHVANDMPSGPDTFKRALSLYLASRGRGNATSQDLQAALEEASGQSWQDFFDQFVRSPGHPVLKATARYEEGALVLDVEQTQFTRTERPWRLFTFPMEVELVDAAGHVTTQTVSVYDARQTFRFPSNAAPQSLMLDPRWLVPAQITLDQTALGSPLPTLAHSPEVTSRVSAIRALAAQDGTLSDEAIALVRADTSLFVKIAALDLLSGNEANREQVLILYRDLSNAMLPSARATLASKSSARDADADADASAVVVRGAVARAEAWLIRTLGRAPTRDEESHWQRRYLSSNLVEERVSLLGMLDQASHERAQQFALDRLVEPRWVTKDRNALIDVLTKLPTAVSLPWIQEALAGATANYLRQILRNLAAAKYDEPALVDLLVQTASSHRQTDVRLKAIAVLAAQVSSKERVCVDLALLATPASGDPISGSLDWVREGAGAARLELCAKAP